MEKKWIDDLLADPSLMKGMLIAGGAKAGRYGESMRILRAIEAQSPRAKEGVFRRLALATALELAAPELCGYKDIDPLKRYAFFEKSYLDKELDSHFDKHSVWLLRQVVNDPQSEEDMLWMREMLWNYRPDQNLAPEEYNARYVGLMYSEFGHRIAAEGETGPPYTQMQRFIDRGSICGGKAFFGRCLGRSFGIPVWGVTQHKHAALSHWTPKGWVVNLGAGFAHMPHRVSLQAALRAPVDQRTITPAPRLSPSVSSASRCGPSVNISSSVATASLTRASRGWNSINALPSSFWREIQQMPWASGLFTYSQALNCRVIGWLP